MDAALAACLCWGVGLTLLVATNVDVAWRTIGVFAAGTSLFFLARSVGATPGIGMVYLAICVMLFVLTAVILLEAFGGIPFISAPGRRPGATLGHRNLAARVACLSLPLLWHQMVLSNRKPVQVAVAMMIAGAIAVIVLLRSRGALLIAVGLVIALPAVTWWRSSGLPKRTRYAWYLWAGAVLVGGSLIVLLPNRLGWRRDDFASSALMAFEYRTGTGRGRIIQAQTTSRIIHDAPVLGVGPGNWSIVYPAYARASDPSVKLGAFYPAPRIPRNDILSFGAEFGAPGVALGIVALIALLGRAVLMLRSSDMVTQQSGLMIFGVSAAAGLLGFFDSIIRIAPTLGLLAVMLGLAVGEGTARTSLQRNAGRGRHFGQRTMLVGYACASFVLARSALQDIATLRVLESARTIEDLHRAVRVAPNNVEARMLLALVLAGAGRCDLARPHVARAALLQPFSGAVRSLRLRCDISMRQP